MLKTTLLFFFVISLALSFEINSPTFIHLTQGVYEFQINGGQMPYEFSVSGLPKGIILDNNKLILQQIVATGQYILSVKASDSSGKLDEKIIILDIDSSSNNMLHRKTTTISNSQSIKTNSPLSVPTITSIKQANINPSIPTISSISNSQSNQQGNQKISFSVQQTSSASQNLANKGSTGQNNIPSQTKIDEGLTISNLKSLFGDTKTLQITTTSSTNSKNSANGNIDFDLTSLSSNNPQSIDFGGTLDLTNKYNISHLNSFFNDINVENSGQSSGITTKTTKSNLNDILSSFSTSDSISNFSQQIKVDGKNINQNIQTKSYKFDLKDSDMIDDEQAFKLFDAQKIAANYVATNFSIVQQMSGNKKTIYDLMMNLSANYESLQQSYKTVMVDLNIAATNKSKIQSAISNMNTHINSITSQIDISNNRRLSLSSQRITLLNKNNQSELQAVQIKQNIDLLNQQLLIVNNSLNNNADSCSKVNQNLIQTDQNITVSNSQLGMINQQLATNSQDVISKQQIVEDLMRRLAIAQRQLSQAQSKSNTLNKQKSDIQQRISTLNQNLITLRSSQATCNSQLPTIRQNIIIINADIQSNITALRNLGGTKEDRINQIAILQNQINQESSKREELIIQKQNAGNALILLQNALPSASNTLNLLISQKSQFQFKLQSEERNLKQTIVKFKEYERKLQFAIMDLQNARAISQQADQAVNAMLARKKNILPYAIGVQSLSTALIGQTVINNNINISNWFNFLSANFGGNLVQYSNQNIQCLYPFNLTSSLQNNIQCPSDADNLKCYSGKIELIKNSYNLMIVSDDTGIMIQLQIPTCATLHSNIINYKFKVGDSVIIKAVPKKDRIFIAKKLLCLRH